MSYKQRQLDMIHETVSSFTSTKTFRWSLVNTNSLDHMVETYRDINYKKLNNPGIPKHVVSLSCALKRKTQTNKRISHTYGKGFKNVKITEEENLRRKTTHLSATVKQAPCPDADLTDYLNDYYDAFSPGSPRISYSTIPNISDSVQLRHSLLFGTQSPSPLVASLQLGNRHQMYPHTNDELREVEEIWTDVDKGRIDIFKTRPALQALHKKLSFVHNRKDKFIELLAYICLSLKSSQINDHLVSPRDVFAVLYAIEANPTASTSRGYVIAAPPGAGKTTLACVSGIIFIDTNLLNIDRIRSSPAELDRIVNNGLSLITHEWDFPKWKSLVLVIRPDDFIKHSTALGFYPVADALCNDLKKQRKDFFRRKVGPRSTPNKTEDDMERYRIAYSSCSKHVYEFRAGRSLVDGFLAILQDFQSCF